MNKISAVVLTKNEKNNIKSCLKSLDFVDEVIVIDDFSSDETLKIIEEIKKSQRINIKIVQKKLNNDFARQRNFGLKNISGDWALFVDSDEEVSLKLRNELNELKNKKIDETISAFYIKRRDFFWGREVRYGEVRKIRQTGLIRLVKKNSGYWIGKVHEEFKIKNGKTGRLKSFLNHYPHPTLKDFLTKVNFYSTLRAKELYRQGKKPSLFQLIFYPFFKFILTYLFYLGFLDGAVGFVYSFVMSFHSFLVRAKLFQYYFEKND